MLTVGFRHPTGVLSNFGNGLVDGSPGLQTSWKDLVSWQKESEVAGVPQFHRK